MYILDDVMQMHRPKVEIGGSRRTRTQMSYGLGFRSLKSWETHLVEFIHELHQNTEQGIQTDAVLMDFSKAFDKVSHSRLLYK